MNFTALEVFLIATQVILLPLIRYFLIQQKDDTIAETKSTIAKITNKAIHYIHENRDNIIKLEDSLKHKITLLKVRQDVLQARIADLEISLTADEHKVFMEYLRVVPGEQEMNVAELLVIENDLIVSSRVYHG
jgi:hypothetical protein